MIKKSIRIHGHCTSIALEKEFWEALDRIIVAENTTLSVFMAYHDSHRKDTNLASHLRVYVLNYYLKKLVGTATVV